MKVEKPKKKEINWYGSKVTVPFDCQIYPEKEVKIANRFSGQECTMPGYAAAVYDTIIGAEQFEDWDRSGLDSTGSSNILQNNTWWCWTDVHHLEYRGRSNAVPAQPEVE